MGVYDSIAKAENFNKSIEIKAFTVGQGFLEYSELLNRPDGEVIRLLFSSGTWVEIKANQANESAFQKAKDCLMKGAWQ